MKLPSLFVAILIGQVTFGQKDIHKPIVSPCGIGKVQRLSEKAILNIFRASIRQPVDGKISIPSNEWLSCNKDSSYFNADTIYFCSNSSYKNKANSTECCELVAWTFYEAKAFILTEVHLCNEPASASAVRREDNYKLGVIKTNNKYFLQTFNNSKLVDRFEILDVKTFPKCNLEGNTDIMTLVRQH